MKPMPLEQQRNTDDEDAIRLAMYEALNAVDRAVFGHPEIAGAVGDWFLGLGIDDRELRVVGTTSAASSAFGVSGFAWKRPISE